LGQYIGEGLPEKISIAELRIVQIAADGQPDLNAPIRILQKGHRQIQRQIDGGGAFDVLTQGQIFYHDLIVSHQQMVLNPIFQIQGKFSGGNASAGEFS